MEGVLALQLLGAGNGLRLRAIDATHLQSTHSCPELILCIEVVLQLGLVSIQEVVKCLLQLALLQLALIGLYELVELVHCRIDTNLGLTANIGGAAQILLQKRIRLRVQLVINALQGLHQICLQILCPARELIDLQKLGEHEKILVGKNLLRTQETQQAKLLSRELGILLQKVLALRVSRHSRLG